MVLISLPEHSLNCTRLTASYMMLSSTQMNMGITGLHKLSRMLLLDKSTFSFQSSCTWVLLRCHHIWMPIMFYTLDIMRVNAYIIFKTLTEANNDPPIDRRSFVMAWIEKLLERSTV